MKNFFKSLTIACAAVAVASGQKIMAETKMDNSDFTICNGLPKNTNWSVIVGSIEQEDMPFPPAPISISPGTCINFNSTNQDVFPGCDFDSLFCQAPIVAQSSFLQNMAVSLGNIFSAPLFGQRIISPSPQSYEPVPACLLINGVGQAEVVPSEESICPNINKNKLR